MTWIWIACCRPCSKTCGCPVIQRIVQSGLIDFISGPYPRIPSLPATLWQFSPEGGPSGRIFSLRNSWNARSSTTLVTEDVQRGKVDIRINEVEDQVAWLWDHLPDAFGVEDSPEVCLLEVGASEGLFVDRNHLPPLKFTLKKLTMCLCWKGVFWSLTWYTLVTEGTSFLFFCLSLMPFYLWGLY